jgi:uncharacterized protein (TIGR02001 family)
MPLSRGARTRAAATRLCLFVLVGVAPPLRAAGIEVTATVAAATDYYFRGVSQTHNEPAVQATVAVEHASGWFGGVFASTVDLSRGPYDYQQHRDVELDADLGYGHEIGHEWLAIARAVHYGYLDQDSRYDSSEIGVGLERRGFAASVSRTDQALGYGGRATVLELVDRRPLPASLALSTGLGWYELQGLHAHCAFWHLALQRTFGKVAADLGYYGSDANGRRLFGDRARGRLVLGLAWHLR